MMIVTTTRDRLTSPDIDRLAGYRALRLRAFYLLLGSLRRLGFQA